MSNENNEKPMSNEEAQKLKLCEEIIAEYKARKAKATDKFAAELAEIISELSIETIQEILANNKKIVAQDRRQLEKIIAVAIRNYGNHCNLNFIDVSNVTDMSRLFLLTNFERGEFDGNISQWDVSNVTNMAYMFAGSHFNGDISRWNVSNVTNMASMFFESHFNGDISNWNVSHVKTMNGMFLASKFNGDVSKWNILGDTDITRMFTGSQLEKEGKIPDLKNFDISGAPVEAKSKTHLSSLIYLAISKYGPEVDLNFIDVSKVSDMSFLFFMSPFKGDISKWNISSDADITDMFKGSQLEEERKIPVLKNFDISGSPVVAKNERHLKSLVHLAISKYGPCVDLNFIDVSNVSVMDEMFDESPFDGNISKWNVSNVKSMKGMFCHSNFNGDISQWKVSNVTDMREMFLAARFNGDISKWDVSSVVDMRNMFYLSGFKGDISLWKLNNGVNPFIVDLTTMRK